MFILNVYVLMILCVILYEFYERSEMTSIKVYIYIYMVYCFPFMCYICGYIASDALNSFNRAVTVHDSPSDKFLLWQLEQILEETCGRL